MSFIETEGGTFLNLDYVKQIYIECGYRCAKCKIFARDINDQLFSLASGFESVEEAREAVKKIVYK